MSAMSNHVITQGEAFLTAAGMNNTNESWAWLMHAATEGDVDLDTPPATPEARGLVIDLFDAWADAK